MISYLVFFSVIVIIFLLNDEQVLPVSLIINDRERNAKPVMLLSAKKSDASYKGKGGFPNEIP